MSVMGMEKMNDENKRVILLYKENVLMNGE